MQAATDQALPLDKFQEGHLVTQPPFLECRTHKKMQRRQHNEPFSLKNKNPPKTSNVDNRGGDYTIINIINNQNVTINTDARLNLMTLGGSPRLGGSHRFFALAATACGRRQSGGCGFAADGIFWAACRHFVGLSPSPSPSLRFWLVIVWLCQMRRRRLAVTLMLHSSLWLGSSRKQFGEEESAVRNR
jgi:hypothetical protein